MKVEQYSCPKVFTDAATRVSFPTYGSSMTEVPCSVFTMWKTDLQHFPTGTGSLAVRWTRNGQRSFETGRTRFAVDDTSYLLFNGGREFSSSVDSDSVVTCYCVSFTPCIAEDALRGMITSTDKLLEDPYGEQFQPVQFFETAYRHDAVVSPVLRRLEEAAESGCEPHGWFAEQFRYLAASLLASHRQVREDIEHLPQARAATRLEVYRRLLVARDFMESNLDRPIGVTDIASVACFSPFHFLRTFKQVFSETPHQYLTRRRVERAKALLINTDMSVTSICMEVGFESLGSFSMLFRRHSGASPERYRALERVNRLGVAIVQMQAGGGKRSAVAPPDTAAGAPDLDLKVVAGAHRNSGA